MIVLASYRLGWAIVAAAILLAAAFTLAVVPMAPTAEPAGRDLGDGAYDLGAFRLVDQSGRAVTDADLADDVWVASFIFTRCPSSCPRITEVVRGLGAGPLKDTAVRFVSVSVDPDHDTPAVLDAYARARGADPDRWLFVTGPKADVYRLILERFHLPVAENPDAAPAEGAGADPRAGAEAVAHSDRLALVDRGNRVIGVFDSGDTDAIRSLIARAKQRSGLARPWVRRLPGINAGLNASCALLLALGWTFIRSGRWRGHAVCMGLGVLVSALFLGCYLVYHYHVGSVAFRGAGGLRFAYFTILISHTLLATFGVVPLVSLTLARALRRRFDRHARIARVTLPIWMYVSVTGVVIYWMLYRLDIPSAALSA